MKKAICYWLAILLILTVSASLYSQNQKNTEETQTAQQTTSWYNGENIRAIIGYEQADASSAPSKHYFFSDLYFSQPFPIQFKKKNNDEIPGPHLRLWGNARLTSVPQPGNTTIDSLVTSLPALFGKLNANQVAQAIEFKVGLDYRLLDLSPNSDNYRYTLNLIAGWGAISPLSPESSMELYEVTPELKNKYQTNYITGETYDYTGKQYAAVVVPKRNRFYRKYFAGIRFKTFINPEKYNGRAHFPAMLDITYGLNDAITGGRLNEGILSLDFFYPLRMNNIINIYFFGSAQLLLNKTHIEVPTFLKPAPDGTQITDPGVIKIMAVPAKSEHYRIGFGVDLATLFKKK
ncbi:MAG: hypothetical protein GY757_08520 [bacterium]|nr:hypothetical protein [bacterium]